MKTFYIGATPWVVFAIRCNSTNRNRNSTVSTTETSISTAAADNDPNQADDDPEQNRPTESSNGRMASRPSTMGDNNNNFPAEDQQEASQNHEEQQSEEDRERAESSSGLAGTYSATLDHQAWAPYSCKGALLPILLLFSFLINDGLDLMQALWSFSIMLEPVAMIPQLLLFRKNRYVGFEIHLFIACMGSYRFLYIVNWIYRAHTEDGYIHHVLVYICGVLQVLMYSDFCYYHCSRRMGAFGARLAWSPSSTDHEEALEDTGGVTLVEPSQAWGLSEPLLATSTAIEEGSATPNNVLEDEVTSGTED